MWEFKLGGEELEGVLGVGFAAATGEHTAGAERHLLGALGLVAQGEQVTGLQVHGARRGEAAVLLDDAKAKVERAARLQAAAVGEAARGAQRQIANELQLAAVAEVAVLETELRPCWRIAWEGRLQHDLARTRMYQASGNGRFEDPNGVRLCGGVAFEAPAWRFRGTA